MRKGKHKLTFLDRLRGWHREERWYMYEGEVVGVELVKHWNWCGCRV